MGGFAFDLKTPWGYLYYLVRDSHGNVRSFQFNYGQMFTNLKFLIQNTLVIDTGSISFQENNLATIQLVPVATPHDGLRFLTNSPNYAINYFNMNLSSNHINTFRIQYDKITSLVSHQFDGTIVVNGVALTPTMLSYMNNCTSNVQNQLNGKLNTSGGTMTGLLEVGGFICDNATFNGDIYLADGTNISQAEFKCMNNINSNIQDQLNSKASLTGGDISVVSLGFTNGSGSYLLLDNLLMNTFANFNCNIQANYDIVLFDKTIKIVEIKLEI
jgi:hypothetical protein